VVGGRTSIHIIIIIIYFPPYLSNAFCGGGEAISVDYPPQFGSGGCHRRHHRCRRRVNRK